MAITDDHDDHDDHDNEFTATRPRWLEPAVLSLLGCSAVVWGICVANIDVPYERGVLFYEDCSAYLRWQDGMYISSGAMLVLTIAAVALRISRWWTIPAGFLLFVSMSGNCLQAAADGDPDEPVSTKCEREIDFHKQHP